MSKTHWKSLAGKEYLGHWDLDGDTVVTITKIEQRPIKGTGGKQEDCLVAILKDQKPMIINATNARTISKLYKSEFIEDWAGKMLTLYSTQVRFGSDMVGAIRVRTRIPQK